jgi:hypothetical protein
MNRVILLSIIAFNCVACSPLGTKGEAAEKEFDSIAIGSDDYLNKKCELSRRAIEAYESEYNFINKFMTSYNKKLEYLRSASAYLCVQAGADNAAVERATSKVREGFNILGGSQ